MKIFLMWNSELQIDGGGDANVETSSLDSSNLIVLKVLHPNVNYCHGRFHVLSTCLTCNHLTLQESSLIHSNANLGVHGQGLLNLSGPGDTIEAQHLVLSLFYNINVSGCLV